MDTELWYAVLAGAVAIVLGLFIVLRAWLFQRGAERAPGKVMGFSGVSQHEGDSREAKFEFETLDGHKIIANAHLGQSSGEVSMGEEITVMYDPKKPTRAKIDKAGMRGYQIGWVVVGIGAFIAVTAIVVTMMG